MNPNLSDIFEQLEFCRSEAARFQNECHEYTNGGGIERRRIPSSTDPDRQIGQVRLSQGTTHLSGRAGMIINSIRATLDVLACRLAVFNNQSHSGAYFPISKDSAVFQTDGERKMRKLNDAHKNIIRSLRPYLGGNDKLYSLHKLDIDRKHISLDITSIGSAGVNIYGGRASFKYQNPGAITEEWKDYCTVHKNNTAKFDPIFILVFPETKYMQSMVADKYLIELIDLVHDIVKSFL